MFPSVSMNTLNIVVFCLTLSLGLSCSCVPIKLSKEFCKDPDLPLVIIRIIREVKSNKKLDIIVKAEVIFMMRQGTDVKVSTGQKIYLITKKSEAECGRAYDFKAKEKFVMRWPRDPGYNRKKLRTRISSCQFFPTLKGYLNIKPNCK